MSLKNYIQKGLLALGLVFTGANMGDGSNEAGLEKVYLTSCVNNGSCTTENKDVKLEEKVMLNAVIEAEVNGRKIYFSDSNNLILNGKKIDPNSIRHWNNGDIDIRWYKVEADSPSYSNTDGKHFNWNPPKYLESLFAYGSNFMVEANAHPTDKSVDANSGLGTMRYKFEVSKGADNIKTPGSESVNNEGITKQVHRVSFRKDDSFIGWLTAFFNLPYIYGSAGIGENHQAERYIGADCADFIVWGYRKSEHSSTEYSSAKGLLRYTNPILKNRDIEKEGHTFLANGREIHYGDKGVNIGDLIFFEDPRGKVNHVGVLFEDKSDPNGPTKGNPNGIFDDYDLMIHILGNSANTERLFTTYFSVGRLKK